MDQDDGTAHQETDLRGSAARQLKEPVGHQDERNVHNQNPPCPTFLSFGPSRRGVPEEENSAQHACSAQGVFACRRPHILGKARQYP